MNKTRVEAFSDGVFAIVITLLILDIKLPPVTYDKLPQQLLQLLPNIGVYVLTFLLIGLYWIFHHYALSFIKAIDGVLLLINLLFLLTLSFLPFPTKIMGEFPFKSLPIAIYAGNLILINLMGFFNLLYLNRNRHLTTEAFTDQRYREQLQLYFRVNLFYVVCIVMGFFYPTVACIMLASIAVFLLIRSVFFVGVGKCDVE